MLQSALQRMLRTTTPGHIAKLLSGILDCGSKSLRQFMNCWLRTSATTLHGTSAFSSSLSQPCEAIIIAMPKMLFVVYLLWLY